VLVASREEELLLYISATPQVISKVLVAEREKEGDGVSMVPKGTTTTAVLDLGAVTSDLGAITPDPTVLTPGPMVITPDPVTIRPAIETTTLDPSTDTIGPRPSSRASTTRARRVQRLVYIVSEVLWDAKGQGMLPSSAEDVV